MGDFDNKIGRGRANENYDDKYCIGDRNEQGDRLITMAEMKHLYIGNTLVTKKSNRSWAWIAPNAATKNVISFVLFVKLVLFGVAIMPSFNTGNDHQLLRAILTFEKNMERKTLQTANRRQRSKVLDEAVLQAHIFSLS
ncbi:unnamed protein product [Soboliphyme baturini]|uniref:DDE_Tnp_1_7 domain-containing protein n=1 Tax=Soboliphyme baturini TaxID=241478 RepID=A0A183J9W0_9BILA|nr:unnamed protein product [Soboliphyme baturini]